MGTAAHRNALDGSNIKRVIQVTPSGSPAGSAGDADAVVAADQTATGVKGYNGTTWDRLRTGAGAAAGKGLAVILQDGTGTTLGQIASNPTDAVGQANGFLLTLAETYVYNGASLDRLRTPNIFKPFSVTVASIGTGQTVWTVASTNKRFRVMGFAVTSDKAVQVNFKDGSVATLFATPAVVAATPFGVSGIGNGMLSASANNLLALDVSASVPVVLTGSVWGTEEV